MNFFNIHSLSLVYAILVFTASGIVVWIAGTKLSKVADELAEKTGIGRAFIGTLLLGGITSLPEMATTITASVGGNAGMAVSNIMGGVSMQVAILAVVDYWHRKVPLSASTTQLVIVMQGMMLVLMLSFAGVFMLVPSFKVWHIGFNSVFIFIVFLVALYLIHHYNTRNWLFYTNNDEGNLQGNINHLNKQLNTVKNNNNSDHHAETLSLSTFLISKKGGVLLLLSLLILVAGYVVVKSSEVIASKTGMGTNFAGLVLIAITTSLPEISTTISAIKLKRHNMAISNIFGTNLFDVALIFLADLFYTEGAVFMSLDNFAVVATFLGIILTTIYMISITIKSKKQVFGIGYDSFAIIATYLLGVVVLFLLQP